MVNTFMYVAIVIFDSDYIALSCKQAKLFHKFKSCSNNYTCISFVFFFKF